MHGCNLAKLLGAALQPPSCQTKCCMVHFCHKFWARGVVWLTRHTVTVKIAGSNPVGPATSFANDMARHSLLLGESRWLAYDAKISPIWRYFCIINILTNPHFYARFTSLFRQ